MSGHYGEHGWVPGTPAAARSASAEPTDELREEIARQAAEANGSDWNALSETRRECWRDDADAVLALPALQRLVRVEQELRELAGEFAFLAATLRNVPAADAYDDAAVSIRRALGGDTR